jgi:hypothetical protein
MEYIQAPCIIRYYKHIWYCCIETAQHATRQLTHPYIVFGNILGWWSCNLHMLPQASRLIVVLAASSFRLETICLRNFDIIPVFLSKLIKTDDDEYKGFELRLSFISFQFLLN